MLPLAKMRKNREILRLAVPNIISNVSVPLLSTVDTALMGQLSALHLGAVGIGSMLFNFIYWNFGFLRMGTTGLTAQAFGANDKTQICQTFSRSLLVAATLAVLLLLLQIPIEWLSITLFQVEAGQSDLVSTYFRIRIWAAPATLASYVLLGWFFGMQNAVYPLYLTVLINVTNIIVSYVLIIHWNLGIAGAAWGTVFAQYLGIIGGALLLNHKYPSLVRRFTYRVMQDLEAFKEFFRINIDLFIRTFSLTFVFAFFYSQSSAAGTLILAANVILLQMVNWMSYGIDGFAFAAESLVGKYKGERNESQVNLMIKYCLYWGFGFASFFALIYALLGRSIFHLFTTELEVIEVGTPYLIYMIFFPIAGFLCYIWDGIYIGLTATRTMRNVMLLSLVLFLVLNYGLKGPYGNHGLWLALLLFLLGRGLIQSIMYRKYGWEIE